VCAAVTAVMPHLKAKLGQRSTHIIMRSLNAACRRVALSTSDPAPSSSQQLWPYLHMPVHTDTITNTTHVRCTSRTIQAD
jgi:hypothetical protein